MQIFIFNANSKIPLSMLVNIKYFRCECQHTTGNVPNKVFHAQIQPTNFPYVNIFNL